MRPDLLLRLFAVCSAIITACQSPIYDGWLDQPITLASKSPLPLFTVSIGNYPTKLTGLIDTAAPLNLVSTKNAALQQWAQQWIDQDDVALRIYANQAGARATRMTFVNTIYPTKSLTVGQRDAKIDVQVVIGTAALRDFVVRLDYTASSPALIFSQNNPDDRDQIAEDCIVDKFCTAVISAPLQGGGFSVIADKTRTLAPSRFVTPLCVGGIQQTARNSPSGLNMTAVWSTALPISVISKSAHERLRLKYPAAVSDVLTDSVLWLPYGAENVRIITIKPISIVSNETIELSACGERQLRQAIHQSKSRDDIDEQQQDFPGASMVKLEHAAEFAVVSDNSPLLQNMRQDLHPQSEDIDIIIGANLLQKLDTSFDYPKQRLLIRCNRTDPQCSALSYCTQKSGQPASCFR